MIDIESWTMWLRSAEALISIPMLIVGLALTLGGWRMGSFCIVITYAVVGGLGIARLTAGRADQVLLAVVAAAALGGLSLWLKRFAIPALGGLIGAAVVMQVLASMGLAEWPLWISGVIALGCVAALCYAHARNVVILITSFEGAVLLLSGLVPLLASSPGLFRFFQGLTQNSGFFFPFIIVVPTFAGVFLQMADARNHDSGLTQA